MDRQQEYNKLISPHFLSWILNCTPEVKELRKQFWIRNIKWPKHCTALSPCVRLSLNNFDNNFNEIRQNMKIEVCRQGRSFWQYWRSRYLVHRQYWFPFLPATHHLHTFHSKWSRNKGLLGYWFSRHCLFISSPYHCPPWG